MSFFKKLFGGDSKPPAPTRSGAQATSMGTMSHSSTKLFEGVIPEYCFVGAPFGGSAPNDLGPWGMTYRILGAAHALHIDSDEAKVDKLQAKLEAKTKTILIPDISAAEIIGNCDAPGSLKHRAMKVMEHKLGLVPAEWECLQTAFLDDALNRCSPVGVLYVFRR